MQRAIRTILLPRVRALGFAGTYPHFRRKARSEYHTLSILFDKYGEGFCVEGGRTTVERFERIAREFSPPLTFEKLNTGSAFRRARFGSPPGQDHWFQFHPWTDAAQFDNLAKQAADALERDAEKFYSAV